MRAKIEDLLKDMWAEKNDIKSNPEDPPEPIRMILTMVLKPWRPIISIVSKTPKSTILGVGHSLAPLPFGLPRANLEF